MAAVDAGARGARRSCWPSVGRRDRQPQRARSRPSSRAPRAAIERGGRVVHRARRRARARLPVACAFHSPLVGRRSARLAEVLRDARRSRSPRMPVYSNTTAAPYPDDPAAIAGAARRAPDPAGASSSREIEAMYDAGARIFVEVGPRSVLTGLVGRMLGERPHLARAASTSPAATGSRGLLPLPRRARRGRRARPTSSACSAAAASRLLAREAGGRPDRRLVPARRRRQAWRRRRRPRRDLARPRPRASIRRSVPPAPHVEAR